MKKALIFQNTLIQVEAVAFPVAPAMVWIDCPDVATVETHIFDGASVVIRPPQSAAEVSALARQKLKEIDAKSIRSIREYIAAKADAPAMLVTFNNDAAIERAKITP